jgi:hypothetical protein
MSTHAHLTQYTYNNNCLPTTVLSVFLPLLTAPLICHSNTKQLHNYTSAEHQTLEKEISKTSGHVPLGIYATYQDVCQ